MFTWLLSGKPYSCRSSLSPSSAVSFISLNEFLLNAWKWWKISFLMFKRLVFFYTFLVIFTLASSSFDGTYIHTYIQHNPMPVRKCIQFSKLEIEVFPFTVNITPSVWACMRRLMSDKARSFSNSTFYVRNIQCGNVWDFELLHDSGCVSTISHRWVRCAEWVQTFVFQLNM